MAASAEVDSALDLLAVVVAAAPSFVAVPPFRAFAQQVDALAGSPAQASATAKYAKSEQADDCDTVGQGNSGGLRAFLACLVLEPFERRPHMTLCAPSREMAVTALQSGSALPGAVVAGQVWQP